jgi:hypothetical protein
MYKYNPFIIGNIVLTIAASVWYFTHGFWQLGLLHVGYTFCGFVLLTMAVIK